MLIRRSLNAARAGLARLLASPRITAGRMRPAVPQTTLDGLTPARLTALLRSATTLQAQGYLELAERMEEADLHYRSQVQTRRLALAGLDVRVVSVGDRGVARRIEDALHEMIEADWWADLTALSDGIAKGYAVGQILWDTSGSEWRPAQIEMLPQTWFRYDPEDGRTLRLIDGSTRGADLPQHGQLIHQPALKAGLPIRAGLARAAAWAYLLKQLALKRWSIAAEVGAVPWRIGRYPAGTDEQNIAILAEAVRTMGADASAVIPDAMQIELISAGKDGGADQQERLCRYLDQQISKAVVGQTMTSDDGASLSQAKVHNEVRLDILEADARALSRTINRDLVRPWVELNWGPQPAYPRLEYPVEWPEDLAALAVALEKLVPLGLDAPLPWVRRKWNVPEPKAGEAVLGATATGPALGAPVAEAQRRGAVAAQRAAAPPDGLDDLVAEALAEWEVDLTALVGPLRAALAELGPQATAAEAIALLPGVLARMDAGPLTERLARAAYTARLAGVAGVEPAAEA